jgi:hypothetical protein
VLDVEELVSLALLLLPQIAAFIFPKAVIVLTLWKVRTLGTSKQSQWKHRFHSPLSAANFVKIQVCHAKKEAGMGSIRKGSFGSEEF